MLLKLLIFHKSSNKSKGINQLKVVVYVDEKIETRTGYFDESDAIKF